MKPLWYLFLLVMIALGVGVVVHPTKGVDYNE